MSKATPYSFQLAATSQCLLVAKERASLYNLIIMLVLRQIFKFIQLLNSESGTNQLAWGFVLGMWMGFTPMATLHWPLYLLLMLVLRINIGATFLAYAAFKIAAFAIDPLFDLSGLFLLLDMNVFRPLYTSLYHAPFFPYTHFYNSVVMGSLVFCLILTVPFFFISKKLIENYRETVVKRFEETRFWKALKATKVYNLYVKYRELYG